MTRVLIFENDDAFAGQLRRELMLRGCTVQVFGDGNTGIMAAMSTTPDLILLSVELPRTNGFSICNKLKRDPELRGVPLVILSSESPEATFRQHQSLPTRAEDYVRKPVRVDELIQRLRRLVRFEPDASVDTLDGLPAPPAHHDVDDIAPTPPRPVNVPSAVRSRPRQGDFDPGFEAGGRLTNGARRGGQPGEDDDNDTVVADMRSVRHELRRERERPSGAHRLTPQAGNPPSHPGASSTRYSSVSEAGENRQLRAALARAQDELQHLRPLAEQARLLGGQLRELEERGDGAAGEVLGLRHQLLERDRAQVALQAQLIDARDQLLAAERELVELRQHADQQRAQLEQMHQALSEANAERAQANHRASETRAGARKIAEQLNQRARDLRDARDQIKALERQVEQANRSGAADAEQRAEQDREHEQELAQARRAAAEELEALRRQAEVDREARDARIAALEAAASTSRDLAEAAEAAWQERLDAQGEALAALEQEHKRDQDTQRAQHAAEEEASRQRLESAERARDEALDGQQALERQVNEMMAQADETSASLAEALTERDALHAGLAETRRQATAGRRERKALEEERDELRAVLAERDAQLSAARRAAAEELARVGEMVDVARARWLEADRPPPPTTAPPREEPEAPLDGADSDRIPDTRAYGYPELETALLAGPEADDPEQQPPGGSDGGEAQAAPLEAAARDQTETETDAALGDAALGDTALGDTALGDTALGDAALGDAALGDAALGDAALGDAALGDETQVRGGLATAHDEEPARDEADRGSGQPSGEPHDEPAMGDDRSPPDGLTLDELVAAEASDEI